jgi:serine/threonine protein kinase
MPTTQDEGDSSPQASPNIGGTEPTRVIPGYEILDELGRGGMGVVYKARQTGLKRLVAIKMILAGGYAGAEQIARFRREAESLAQLQHQNVVQIYEISEVGGLPFFSLEYVDGGSLAHKLQGGPLSARHGAQLLQTLAKAMHAAHLRGIIHRDLKPANVLLTGDGVPKITDFGLAKQLEGHDELTRSGAIMGTPSYMAPEQASGHSSRIGPRVDVYALGAILYCMLTGRPPFRGASLVEILDQVRFQDPVRPCRMRPDLPSNLEDICLKCLNKQPEQRYHTAMELAQDLEQFLANEALGEERPVARQVFADLNEDRDSSEPPTADLSPDHSQLDGLNLQVGQEPIPGYRLIEHLVSYDLSHIYKAEGPGGFPVALQWKPRSEGDHQQLLDKSLDLFKSIRHPHLLSIFGVWRTDKADIVAMELADCTLEDRLRQVRELGQSGIAHLELLQYMEDASKGIDYLNEPRHTLLGNTGMSVVHGDIKPRHLRLVGGRVKVAEFLFAECVDPAQPDRDTRKDIRGTPAFMAPERARGETFIQTDQYSLAASYHCLRTGRHLFAATTPMETLRQCLEEDPDLAALPAQERRVLLRALARRPRDRWPSCQAFVKALVEAVEADGKR